LCHYAHAQDKWILTNSELSTADQNFREWAALGYTPIITAALVVGGPALVEPFGGQSGVNALIKAAQEQYPGKAGNIELHHVFPKYLGGSVSGTVVAIDAAYHQVITNEFRALWAYGQGAPVLQRAQEIMQQVYNKFPLP